MTTKKKATKSEAPQQQPPQTPPPPPGMKIIAMQVDNIKRIKFARIRPKGNMVEISGNNGEGKSSVLDAIDMALTGTTSIPSMPIRKGQRVGQIQIDLGDFKVVRDFTVVEGGKDPWITKLTVLGKSREKFPTPQSILDGLMGQISFDPLEFIRMDAKRQFAALSAIANLDLAAIDEQKKAAYEERRVAGRELERVRARFASFPKPKPDLPAKPIDEAALTQKLQQAAEHNSAIAQAKREQALKRQEADYERTQQIAINAQIADLQRRMEELRADVKKRAEAEAALRAEADAMKFDEPIVTADVALELEKARQANRDIQQREAYLMAERELAAAAAIHDELDGKVRGFDQQRTDAIAKAKMPIDGLSIGDGEVLYSGIPFNQASNAEQIRVSIALAMASNPKLRVLRIKDGSLLDAKSLELIRTMATEADYQMWIERVDASDPISVVMEDGEAHGEQTEPQPAGPGRRVM